MPPGIGYRKKKERNQKESRRAGIAYTGGSRAAALRERNRVDRHFAETRSKPRKPSAPAKTQSAISRLWGALTSGETKIGNALTRQGANDPKEVEKRRRQEEKKRGGIRYP